jgi:hypothetical protein
MYTVHRDPLRPLLCPVLRLRMEVHHLPSQFNLGKSFGLLLAGFNINDRVATLSLWEMFLKCRLVYP